VYNLQQKETLVHGHKQAYTFLEDVSINSLLPGFVAGWYGFIHCAATFFTLTLWDTVQTQR
jgi:hypothetical protein